MKNLFRVIVAAAVIATPLFATEIATNADPAAPSPCYGGEPQPCHQQPPLTEQQKTLLCDGIRVYNQTHPETPAQLPARCDT